MTVTAKIFGLALQSLWNKEIDFDTDTTKVMLCTSAYVPNQDTHRYKSDITNEISGPGYTAGGAGLTNVTVSYNASTNTLTLDADDAQWTSATFTARYAVIYDASPAGDSTRPLLGYVDMGGDVSVVSGAFTVAWDPAGIFTFTVA